MYAWSYTCTSIIYIHVVVFPIKCQSFWDNQTYPIGAASRTKLAKQNIHPQLSANPKPSLMSHPGDPVISTENPSGKVKKISVRHPQVGKKSEMFLVMIGILQVFFVEALQIIPAFCVGISTLPPTPFLKPYSDQPQDFPCGQADGGGC